MKQLMIFLLTIVFFCVIVEGKSQEVTMFPSIWGTKHYEDDTQISKKEIRSLMEEHELTKLYWDKSRLHNSLSAWSGVAVVLLAFWDASSDNGYLSGGRGSYSPQIYAALGVTGLSIGFTISSNKLRRQAVLSYNKINTDDQLIYHIGQTRNGVGLV